MMKMVNQWLEAENVEGNTDSENNQHFVNLSKDFLSW